MVWDLLALFPEGFHDFHFISLQDGNSEDSSKSAGLSVIFSDTNLSPIKQSLSGKQFPRLSVSLAEVQAVVLGLETAKTKGFLRVEVRTSSRHIEEIFSKWLVIWKKNKWKRGNGGRLVIPVPLLRRLDHLVSNLTVNILKVARGGSPEIVMAETLAKQSCQDLVTESDQNFNAMGAEEARALLQGDSGTLNLSKQMEQSIVVTMKKRFKERNRRKIKRKIFGQMRKKIQL